VTRRAVAVIALLALAGPTRSARALKPRTVAVLEYRAGVTSARELGEHLSTILEATTSLRVVAPSEARRRLAGHTDAMVARCAGESVCIAEVGLKLGAEEVVLVGLSQLGGDLIVAMQRIRVADGQVQGRTAESIARNADPTEEALLDYLRRLMPPEDFVRYGTVRVRTQLVGATVLLDGQVAGHTPLQDLRVVAPHKITLRVEKDGFVPFQARLEVLPNAVAEVAPELPPEGAAPPLYKRWWFWGALAVVAGATVTTIALTRDTSSSATLVINPPR